MLQGPGCDTLRLKCSKLKGKFKYGNRGITPAINVYYSPADVEAFTFLDSESPATTSTYTISLEFMQQSCKVFFLFKIKKKKNSVQDMSERLVALLPLASRQQIII